MLERGRGLVKAIQFQGTVVSLLLFLVFTVSLPAYAVDAASATTDFRIGPSQLADALSQLGAQSGVQVVYSPELAQGLNTKGVSGRLTVDAALKQLLAGTGITWSYVNGDTVVLKRAQLKAAPQSKAATPSPSQGEDLNSVSEIIVSAQKKGEERLQDVPIPMTALSASELSDNNQVRLRDYFSSVPGLNISPNIEGNQVLSIRGITTGGFTNPTVGVIIDDVPFGASTNSGAGNQIPDIDPGDLARIEVLRGPQGTLYGANSMGGLVKFVTVDPSSDGYSGRIEAGTSGVKHGAQPGFVVRASGNIPVSDSVAIRISGFSRQDPGYVDNVLTGLKGVNEAEVYGGRVALLWRPSDELSVKFSALYQDTKTNGVPDVISGLGDLSQNYIPETGASDRRIQAYNLTLRAKLGIGELTSITAYSDTTYKDSLDLSSFFGPYTVTGCATAGVICPPGTNFNGFGVAGAPQFDYFTTEKLTQELRYQLAIGQNLDWLVGVFYDHETNPDYQTLWAEDPVTGHIAGQWAYFGIPITFRELAAFTDLTYRFTDRFDVQLGARESQTKEFDYPNTAIGVYTPVFLGTPSPFVPPFSEASSNIFTYLLTPRFKLSSDVMLYARFASGYRPGGTNLGAPGAPPTYAPDKTQNYEVGVKGDFLDHRLSVDASLYYISWKDLQMQLFLPNSLTYEANGSGAKSEGLEISLQSRPLSGLTLSGWFAYDNAVLTQAFPANGPAYGVPGTRLPNSSRFSGNLSVEQVFPLGTSATGFVGAMASYMGDREGLFTGSPGVPAPRQLYPAYTKTDVRAGVKYDAWTVNLYATNVFDKRGLIAGGLGYFLPTAFTTIPPRTVGVSVSKVF